MSVPADLPAQVMNTKPLFKLMVEKKGIGSVLYLQRAGQDQNRRQDFSRQ